MSRHRRYHGTDSICRNFTEGFLLSIHLRYLWRNTQREQQILNQSTIEAALHNLGVEDIEGAGGGLLIIPTARHDRLVDCLIKGLDLIIIVKNYWSYLGMQRITESALSHFIICLGLRG